jgi:hypothetical protein
VCEVYRMILRQCRPLQLSFIQSYYSIYVPCIRTCTSGDLLDEQLPYIRSSISHHFTLARLQIYGCRVGRSALSSKIVSDTASVAVYPIYDGRQRQTLYAHIFIFYVNNYVKHFGYRTSVCCLQMLGSVLQYCAPHLHLSPPYVCHLIILITLY